jgi:site-specific DNA-methyltransferase (adenine-specific)
MLDFFAGSGTTGEAAAKLGRQFVMVDSGEEAVAVMYKRLCKYGVECIGFAPEENKGEMQ